MRSRTFRSIAVLMIGAVLLWASGIAPQAYNLIQTDSGSILPRASTLKFHDTATVTWVCATAAGVTTCQATGSGGATGAGIVVYSSGAAIAPAGTQFIPIGGGGQISGTESDVRIGAPSGATVNNMFVNLDLPPGIGNSIAFTWRKAGADQTLTCTVSGAVATTCSDITHSFTVSQGDLVDIKLVTTGTVIVAPGLTIATQFGTSSGSTDIHAFGASFGGAGTALSSGTTVYTTIPYACTIQAWNITVDTGTATVDLWKIATGTAVPTIANTITAAALPAISSGTAIHSTTLTAWTTSVSANDILGVNLNAVSGATYLNIVVQCQ